MTDTTGLSGNEIYCLAQKELLPGGIVVGNSVHSLGMLRSFGTGLKSMLGGELHQVTNLIAEGRETAYKRLLREASDKGAAGVTGVTSDIIFHDGNIEFLSIGSAIFAQNGKERSKFTTSDDGQQLYAQLDAGYQPICFAFGNVAYSMGIARGLLGGLKTLARGEITEYSNMFNITRHLALNRIIEHARQYKANAVLGINTTILPFGNTSEMLMIGTASRNNNLSTTGDIDIVTSDMTNIELWNMAKIGYEPVKLVLGTSVYSLGLIGGITSSLKSLIKGEISELSHMIYAARENALGMIADEARAIGADDVIGVKTYVYQLGNGLIEFLAIGTAVKKTANAKTQSEQLVPQAIIVDKDTFFDSSQPDSFSANLNKATNNKFSRPKSILPLIFLIVIFIILKTMH